jgi:hypothetical protein
MLLARYGYIRLKFAENWAEAYRIAEQPQQAGSTEEAA